MGNTNLLRALSHETLEMMFSELKRSLWIWQKRQTVVNECRKNTKPLLKYRSLIK